MAQNTDPRQTPNWNPATNSFHADPRWRDSAHRRQERSRRGLDMQWPEVQEPDLAPQPAASPNIDYAVPEFHRTAGTQGGPTTSPQAPTAMQGLQTALRPTPAPQAPQEPAEPYEGPFSQSSGPSMGANDPLALRGLRESRMAEMKRNIGRQAGDPYYRAAATPADIDLLQTEMDDDPFTGREPRERVAAFEGLQNQANLAGFSSPQEQARYGREQEEFKVRVPIEAAKIGAEGDLSQQRLANQGAIDVQKQKDSGLGERLNDFTQLKYLFGPDVSSVNVPGVGSVATRAPQQVPVGLNQAVTVARQNLRNAGATSFSLTSGMEASPEQEGFNQAVGNVIARFPARFPGTRSIVTKIMSDPNLVDLPLSELGDSDDPLEQAEIEQLLLQVRGIR